jgi:transcriptional regulator GlxA family with amidase domain
MLYSANPVVPRSLDYMREHLGKPFNISAVAEHSVAFKRTLEMRFRESIGSSPREFLTKLRIERAGSVLLMPEKRSIEQIAAECGFGTAAIFYAAFRRLTGQSPASFLRESSRPSTASG